MTIDFEGHRILTKDKIIYLTKTENDILEVLYKNKNKVSTYQDIVDKIYQTECDDLLKKIIRKYMVSIRNKVRECIRIRTVRGVGYIIEEEF